MWCIARKSDYGTVILGSFFSGVVIIAVCCALGDSILYALGATEATIALTRDYGNIIFLMMPLVQNTLASIIRADGSPRCSMAAMMVGAVINMIGDPVAIFVLGWGIKGAAYATILGQFVSFPVCAAYLRKSRVFRVKAADFIPSWEHLRPVLPLGCGSFLTQLCIVATAAVCVAATVLFEALPLAFIRLFGADGELYTTFAVYCLRIYLSLLIFTCLQKACAMFLQSIGHARAAVPLSILRDVLLIAFSLIIPTQMGVTGIFWAAPAADLAAMVITAAVIARVWKQLSVDSSIGPERTAELICDYISRR